jgi:hypothetical protein
MAKMKTTNLSDLFNPADFLRQALEITNVRAIVSLLDQLPVVSEDEYVFDAKNPERGWVEGKLHWIPLGKDRGNAGRIKLASRGENPIAERAINSMEAMIELQRRLELLKDPSSPVPQSPREAVMRYFSLPPGSTSEDGRADSRSKATRIRARACKAN